MKLSQLIVTYLAFATAIGAKANYQFDWQGNSNLFQASFQMTDTEMLPGQVYYPSNYPLSLTTSLSIGSPDGTTFTWRPNPASGQSDLFGLISSGPPPVFNIELSESSLTFSYVEVFASPHIIQEYGYLANASSPELLFSEPGQWEITYIPEPSAAALLGIGVAAWLARRKMMLVPMGGG